MVQRLPSVPVGHSVIPLRTPLHVTQLVLVLLKSTFADTGGPNYPYRFTNDFATTGVVIDTDFNKDSGIYGKKPALIVSRGPVSTSPVAVGDAGYTDIPSGNALRSTLLSSSVQVKVVSKSNLEVDILGNEVLNFLVTCRTMLPQLTSLSMIQSVSLSDAVPFDQDDRMYYCTAALAYSLQYKWSVEVRQHILKGIDLYINDTLAYQAGGPPPATT